MAATGPRVVAVWEGGSFVRPLPAQGALVIGRGQGSEVLVDHPSVSRRHAILHVGADLRIEDLGSANGTRIGNKSVPSGGTVVLEPSQVIAVGDALLTFQGIDESSAEPPPAESMEEVARLVALVAKGIVSVLLLGETGVGKEVVAERIHLASPRASKPFIRLNCAAFTEPLVESELFGHERGAFTGAASAKAGLLEAADGGTMFLDEVGELPLALQAKLLRVLDTREVTRVGALRPRTVDVRFVCATNRDLAAMCAARTFRDDLYHRLNGITIRIPALRWRRAEIASLAREFVEHERSYLAKPTLRLSAAALARLETYDWPGNVRELKKCIQRAALLANSDTIDVQHLRLDEDASPSSLVPPPSSVLPPSSMAPASSGATPDLRGDLANIERARIVEALAQHAGNQTRAAAALGISRRTLISRMDAYGLPRPRKPA